MIDRVLIDGEPSDGRIEITDSSVLRGDGCFEVMRCYGGRAFAIEEHLERLERSAASLEIEIPPRAVIAAWVEQIAAEQPGSAIRVVVTRGSALPGSEPEPHVIVFGHEWQVVGSSARLHPVPAPWHSSGETWALSGAKVLSYAANLSATRVARRHGCDDALLVTPGFEILEGPTFTFAWVVDGVLETPGIDLGILDSITRRHVIGLASDVGIGVVEGRWPLSRLEDASEAMVMSTIREVQAVTSVGDLDFATGPVTTALAAAFAQLVGSVDSAQTAAPSP